MDNTKFNLISNVSRKAIVITYRTTDGTIGKDLYVIESEDFKKGFWKNYDLWEKCSTNLALLRAKKEFTRSRTDVFGDIFVSAKVFHTR